MGKTDIKSFVRSLVAIELDDVTPRCKLFVSNPKTSERINTQVRPKAASVRMTLKAEIGKE